VSEIIGQALFGDGAQAAVYRALRQLVCSRCGGVVAAGEMFTRDRKGGQQGLRLWPRCRRCVPFALDTGKQARSPLLQSLLNPTQQQQAATENRGKPDHATNDERQKAEDERQRVDEAMRRRLGPALERARRSRSGNR
ncbi:MAG TPA: hypothetical protein VGC89_03380, partial [Pyrinomonadaceae bacterium]